MKWGYLGEEWTGTLCLLHLIKQSHTIFKGLPFISVLLIKNTTLPLRTVNSNVALKGALRK